MTTVVLMGPPGAGKGTHAGTLAEQIAVPAIATGDIFRAHVAAGSELGRTAQQYVDSGAYVPDEVTNAMIRERLAAADARSGFLLDGYPRTLDQAGVLDELLVAQGRELTAVVVLHVDRESLVARLLNRAQVQGRSDDSEDVVRHRLEVYSNQTVPLLSLYGERGLLHEIDGNGDITEVRERLLEITYQLTPAR
ncbi:adenylate kinase [Kribbella sandramycini]|uniref:Adenylate kinase n=2 Tax=Kribbella sandramycini TaxID=60450 RepID=A0A841SP45_9ACTN|nr:adenylate kinase [Kribbella sandramycini]